MEPPLLTTPCVTTFLIWQACLDHTFEGRHASCLVNPRAGFESSLQYRRTQSPLKLAVVGAGVAGLAFATTAARRGHEVTLFEAEAAIGGQFNYAKQIPGKEEFYETLRYYEPSSALSPHQPLLGRWSSTRRCGTMSPHQPLALISPY